jgi:hypothetical protein
MLEHLVALGRLGLQEELIEDNGRVRLFSQAGDGLLQVFRPVSLVAGFDFQTSSALLAACRRCDE